MTIHLCACYLQKIYKSIGDNIYVCKHDKSPVDPRTNLKGKKSSNQVPEWCPLKIKYRFPYHIVR